MLELSVLVLSHADCREVMTSQGIQTTGLMIGTSVWAMVGLIAWIIARLFFVKDYPRIKKADSASLSNVVVLVGTVCLWLFWSFVYMHQMVPLIYPQKGA